MSIFKPNPETGGRVLSPKFVITVGLFVSLVSLVFVVYYVTMFTSEDAEISAESSGGSGNAGRAYSQLLEGRRADDIERDASLRDYAESVADPLGGKSSRDILRTLEENEPAPIPVSNLGEQILSGNSISSLSDLDSLNTGELSGYVPFAKRLEERERDRPTSNSASLNIIYVGKPTDADSAVGIFTKRTTSEEDSNSDTAYDDSLRRLEENLDQRLSSQENAINKISEGQASLQDSMQTSIEKVREEEREQQSNVSRGYEIGGMGTPTSIVSSRVSSNSNAISANSVPTGTNIPVVLLQDVVSRQDDQTVWVQVAQDVYFRNQVQLPKGVRMRGISSGYTREMVDIEFNLMVFPDGTELDFEGKAVNGFDPMFPNTYKMKGITGKYVVPPVWTKLLPIFTEAAIGYTDNNREFRQPTGSGDAGASQGPAPDNEERSNEALNRASQALGDMVIEDLQRYSPYVHLRRGQSFFVQTDVTVDFSLRALGGFANRVIAGPSTADNLSEEVSAVSNPRTNQIDIPDRDSPVSLPNSIPTGLRDSIESYLE